MDLLNLGLKSRKTGIRPKVNLRKDKHQMENVDEFFSDDDENLYKMPITDSNKSNTSYRTIDNNFNHIARKINFDSNNKDGDSYNFPVSSSSKHSVKKKNKKSPLRSPLPEHKTKRLFVGNAQSDIRQSPEPTKNKFTTNDESEDDYDDMEYNFDGPNESLSEPEFDSNLSPVSIGQGSSRSTPNKDDPQSRRAGKAVASFTKRIAVGRSTKKQSNATRLNYASNPVSDEMDEVESKPFTPVNVMKRTRNISSGGTPREVVIKPSPLPSPPPENSKSGLRRSKRTKLKPLAYWRNERINYVQAGVGSDPNTTLAKDIHNIPLQTIESWVEVQESNATIPRTRKTTPPKDRKETSKKSNLVEEANLGLEGTEWFSDGRIELKVFANEKELAKTVAFTSEGMQFKAVSDEQHDDFEVATLFSEDKDICASGLMDFPIDGVKGSKASNDMLFIFFVVQGLFEVNLGNNQFIVNTGCSFQVPPGNFYSFKNKGNDRARLFFVQTRIPQPDADDNWE